LEQYENVSECHEKHKELISEEYQNTDTVLGADYSNYSIGLKNERGFYR